MSISPVQYLGLPVAGIASGSPSSVLSSNPLVGNTVVLAIVSYTGASGDIKTVTTTFGTATQICAYDRSGVGTAAFYGVSVNATGNSITVTTNSGANWNCMAVEWPGSVVSAYSLNGNNVSTSTPTLPVTAITPGDLLIVQLDANSSISANPSSNTPAWNVLQSGTFWEDSDGCGFAWYQAPDLTTLNPTWTLAASAPNTILGMGLQLPSVTIMPLQIGRMLLAF